MRIAAFLRSFLGLRGKLTLTYTAVTVSAMLAIEVVGIGLFLTLNTFYGYPQTDYIQDVINVLYPRAAVYLETDPPDVERLQAWLDDTYESGYASLPPTTWTDSPAARIAKQYPMYVTAIDGTILAAAPETAREDIGKAYSQLNTEAVNAMIEATLEEDPSVSQLYSRASDGALFVLVPVLESNLKQPVGLIALYVEPPPSWLLTAGPAILGGVLLTGILLAIGIMPFGTLFGFIMSHGLTRRLSSLARAADAWSHGDFSVVPQDRARDEIGDLQERLIHMSNQLQDLMQTRQELAGLETRNHLARELHDTVKQQIFAATMQIRAAKNLVDKDPDALKQHLNEVEKLLKLSQGELATIINEMRPAALEGQSLADALRLYIDTWSQHTGIETAIQINGEQNTSVNIDHALYRVAQEGLANIARHSHAARTILHLEYTQNTVTLILEDKGQGFAPSQPQATGFGLQSMRQRVAELGGVLTITSKPGTGTTLRAEVPLNRSSP